MTFGSAAGIPLAGWLDLPDGDPTAVALFAHCFTGGQDGPAAARIARGLTDRGIAVLRFDFTGPGGSADESADTAFGSSIEDLVAAADFLRKGWGGPSCWSGTPSAAPSSWPPPHASPRSPPSSPSAHPVTPRTSRTCRPARRRRSRPVGRPTC